MELDLGLGTAALAWIVFGLGLGQLAFASGVLALLTSLTMKLSIVNHSCYIILHLQKKNQITWKNNKK